MLVHIEKTKLSPPETMAASAKYNVWTRWITEMNLN
jgi:hypothetical protein